MSNLRHVGIIGAGVAGLRCADVLLQRGFRVTILEARNRIGGRVHQQEIGNYTIDMGPNWIHGTDNNPINDLCKVTNTVTHGFEGPHLVMGQDGAPVPTATASVAADFVWTLIEKTIDWSLQNQSKIPAHLDVFEYMKAKIEESDLSKEEKGHCIESSKVWGSYIGSPIDRQSLKFFFMEGGVEGENLFVASTYKKILEHISKPARTSAQIVLEDAVNSIQATTRQHTGHQVAVHTVSGKQYEFDEVVSTLPLGWLKKNKSIFDPPLPERISKAIDSLSYGALEKIYVHFPSAFWHVNTVAQGQEGETSKPVQIVDFENPTYAELPYPSPFWNQECVSLAALPKSCSHPTLLFYLYGPSAEYITSAIANLDPASKEYYDFITNFLKPFYSRIPHFDEANPACRPAAVVATQWSNDPLAGNGSYTNFQVGLEGGTEDVDVLSDGMGAERGVWFAGEHTSPLLGLGTVTGAYWSGENAAEKICNFYEGKAC